ncbi:patatin-like phospholipase family protein [Corallococcus sp. M34]|uniref:patatin-like phospholipase family protein n=1 Tax=Citreicoccus inhibens TaxID=2849499 RepID=UPI0013157E39|nr:patatin-like phospholipase family protein [Citreicoccus inhibens]MBU8897130.1 patatin-like phospholipase family protein [Citreicoccus inhibens]
MNNPTLNASRDEALRDDLRLTRFPSLREALLTVAQTEALSEDLERLCFAPGTHLGEDAASAGLHVLLSGEAVYLEVAAADGYRVQQRLLPGMAWGEENLTGEPWSPGCAPKVLVPTTVLRIRREAYARMVARVPALEAAVLDLRALRRQRVFALASTRRSGPAHGAAEYWAERMDSAVVRVCAEGEELVGRGGSLTGRGWYIVLAGTLRAWWEPGVHPPEQPHLVPPAPPRAPAEQTTELTRGAVFWAEPGEVPPGAPVRLSVTHPTRLAFLPSVGSTAEPFPGSLHPIPVTLGRLPGVHPPSRARGDVVLLQSDVSDAPLSTLSALLADTVATQHHDRVLHLTLVPPGTAPLPPRSRATAVPGQVAHLHAQVADGQEAARVLRQVRDEHPAVFDLIFVDASALGAQAPAELGPAVTRLLYLSRRPGAVRTPPELSGATVLLAALLDGTPILGLPPGALRVKLDLARLATHPPGGLRYADLDAAQQATFCRWGRALTGRRVGFALGGGAGWCYAHVTLLRRVLALGIPIDILAGTSMGSMMAAFYCVEGVDGLEHALESAGRLDRATLLGYFTGAAISRYMDSELGPHELQSLEIPLLTVSTNVSNGTMLVCRKGPLGMAVRLSASFPLRYPPTMINGLRHVDGAFVNNIPCSLLVGEGVGLNIGANVIPMPMVLPPEHPWIPGALGRFLAGLNPIARTRDLIRGLFTLLNQSARAETAMADFVYTSDDISVPPWSLKRAREIAALAEPSVEKFVEQLHREWQHFSRELRPFERPALPDDGNA